VKQINTLKRIRTLVKGGAAVELLCANGWAMRRRVESSVVIGD
jgi:hypothetical protein